MRLAVLLCLMLLSAVSVSAQTYTVERAVIGATGGTVSGGPFQLNFTVGQPTTGSGNGATTKLNPGFWWEVLSPPSVDVVDEPPPTTFALGRSMPNPFINRTVIHFDVPAGTGSSSVYLAVYDVNGRQVRTLVNDHRAPGRYTATWDGRDDTGGFVSAGVYFIRFQAPNFLRHHRVVMLK